MLILLDPMCFLNFCCCCCRCFHQVTELSSCFLLDFQCPEAHDQHKIKILIFMIAHNPWNQKKLMKKLIHYSMSNISCNSHQQKTNNTCLMKSCYQFSSCIMIIIIILLLLLSFEKQEK